MVFQQKLWEKAFNLIFKLTGRAKVRPASSDKWKAPFLSSLTHKILLWSYEEVPNKLHQGALTIIFE